MELTCPKCHGTMRTYERNGVHVDQCTECRGIFLDRGELERLIDAENDWHERGGRAQSSSAGHQPSGHQSYGHQSHGRPADAGLGAVVGEVLSQVRGQKHSGGGHYGRKRKESFLGDLFG